MITIPRGIEISMDNKPITVEPIPVMRPRGIIAREFKLPNKKTNTKKSVQHVPHKNSPIFSPNKIIWSQKTKEMHASIITLYKEINRISNLKSKREFPAETKLKEMAGDPNRRGNSCSFPKH